MQVILLERVHKLGSLGEVVDVKPGFARNFLLPQQKALRATKSNLAVFEQQKKELESLNQQKKEASATQAEQMNNKEVVIIRQAGEGGQLFGSVNARDIAAAFETAGFKIEKSMIQIPDPIKMIGIYNLTIMLHPEVVAKIRVNVAKTEEEAVKQRETENAPKGKAAKFKAAEEALELSDADTQAEDTTEETASEE